MTDRDSGWWPDPTGRHQWRHYANGWPTDVVRDGDVVSEDRFELSARDWPFAGGQPYQPPGPWGPPGTWAPPVHPDPRAQWPGYPPAQPFYAPQVVAPARRRWVLIGVIAGVAVIVVATLVAVIASHGSSSPTAASDYPTDGGVLITDTDAHFSARFPLQPTLQTSPTLSLGTGTMVIRLAGLKQPHLMYVEEADISESMSQAEYDGQLRGAIGGFEGTSGMTLISQQATTFQGHTARTAQMSTATTRYTVLFFVYDANRFYGVVAPSGANFTTLSGSLVILS